MLNQNKNLVLKTLRKWNELEYSKPLLGRCTLTNIEFYVNSVHLKGGLFLEDLKNCLKAFDGAGVAFLGYCGSSEFTDQIDEVNTSIDVSDSRFRRYRLYLAGNIEELEVKELTERCKAVEAALEIYL